VQARKPADTAGAKWKKWMPLAVTILMTVMVCVTVNYRAYSELRSEQVQFETLGQQVDAVTTENLSLQEEIHYLKNDPEMIRREAQKFGFVPRGQKVPVSGGK
jgi:cell division protein FtsB